MKKSELTYFRQHLIDWRDQLLRDAEYTLNRLLNDSSTNAPDPLDRAAIESERSFSIRIRDRESRLIKKIEGALMRIDEGTFGICESCGEDIAINRLMARPVTSYCVDCKEVYESLERMAGG